MKTFKPYTTDGLLLLPAALQDWLPEARRARFLSDVVDHTLGLTPVLATSESGVGPGVTRQPELMVKLLLYAYSTGKPSSRQIEKATYAEVPYRVLASGRHPDRDHPRRPSAAAPAAPRGPVHPGARALPAGGLDGAGQRRARRD